MKLLKLPGMLYPEMLSYIYIYLYTMMIAFIHFINYMVCTNEGTMA